MSLYEGDMNSRILAGEKMEDVLKNPDAPKTDWAELSKNVLNNNSIGIPIAVKPTSEEIKQQNTIILQNVDVLTQEDKFYEKLGIKYHNTHMFGVDSRLKGRLLVAVVLIVGYFAYKKFKK